MDKVNWFPCLHIRCAFLAGAVWCCDCYAPVSAFECERIDACQWVDGMLGRVVQQTLNQEEPCER